MVIYTTVQKFGLGMCLDNQGCIYLIKNTVKNTIAKKKKKKKGCIYLIKNTVKNTIAKKKKKKIN